MVLFWDFDGTLVNSNPLWSNSVYQAIKMVDCNVSVSFDDVRKCMANGFTWHMPDEDFSFLIDDKWWEYMNRKFFDDYISLGVDAVYANEAVKNIRAIIKKVENYTLYDDAVDVLKMSIQNNNINVLLSNNYPDLNELISELGLSEYFDRIIVSAKVGYDKPRKEIFDIAKSYYPNEKYIMIGDNVSADIVGGKIVGMTTILVHNGFCDEADYCFDNLLDINFAEL